VSVSFVAGYLARDQYAGVGIRVVKSNAGLARRLCLSHSDKPRYYISIIYGSARPSAIYIH
jgi:hypothetical protein